LEGTQGFVQSVVMFVTTPVVRDRDSVESHAKKNVSTFRVSRFVRVARSDPHHASLSLNRSRNHLRDDDDRLREYYDDGHDERLEGEGCGEE
jgi:hypothetical protein